MQTNPETQSRHAHQNITLRVFVDVAESGSFSKVARAMKNSQPNVTHHIRKLEEYLLWRVLTRNQSGAYLTTFGEKAYDICKQISALEDQLDCLRKDAAIPASEGVSDKTIKRVLISKMKAMLDELEAA